MAGETVAFRNPTAFEVPCAGWLGVFVLQAVKYLLRGIRFPLEKLALILICPPPKEHNIRTNRQKGKGSYSTPP